MTEQNRGAVPEEKGLVPYERSSAITLPDTKNLRELATEMLNSEFFASIKKAPQAMAIILHGAEIGLTPTVALQTISIVNGRMCISTTVLQALFQSKRGKIKILERSETKARVEFTKPGMEPYVHEYTQKDAQLEELWGKQNWTKRPKTMLLYRAISGGLRVFDPGSFLGIVTIEEAEDYPGGLPEDAAQVDPNAGKGPETVTIKKTAQKPPKADAPEGQPVAEKPKEAPKQAPATAKKPPTEPVLGGFEPPPAEDDIAGMAESPEGSKEEEDLILAIKAGIEAAGVDQKPFKEWLINHQTKMKDPNKRPRVFLVKLGKSIRFHGANLEDLKYLKANLVGAFSLFHSPKPYGIGEPKAEPGE